MHFFFSFHGCKETTTAKENSTIIFFFFLFSFLFLSRIGL